MRLPNRFHAVIVAVVLLPACASRRSLQNFRVLPGKPDYVLRSPDSSNASFPEVLRQFNRFVAGQGWMELRPSMELRLENAYYKQGMPKHGLAGFLGTEIARYQVGSAGMLRRISVQSGLFQRPADQPAVQDLIQRPQLRFRHHRFFFAIVFKRQGESRGSVLLGSRSAAELDSLASRLLVDPDSVCGVPSRHCTVFPEACSVSPEIEVTVNGKTLTVPWGTVLATIASKPRRIGVFRSYSGRMTPVEIDPSDPNALRLPLLPGDRILWE